MMLACEGTDDMTASIGSQDDDGTWRVYPLEIFESNVLIVLS